MGAIEFQGATTIAVGISANPSLTIASGQSVTLTASGGSSYSWSSGQSTIAISVSVAGTYSVTGITGSCSDTATVTVSVAAPPSITAQPVPASSVCQGASVMVMVGVSGSISGHQWLKGGNPVAGQTTATLSLGNIQVGDAGVYSLSITGPGGSTISTGFTLTVSTFAPTVIITLPNGSTVNVAGNLPTLTLPPTGNALLQVSGGVHYERVIIVERINGYEIRQVDSNTTGIFLINRLGLFTLTVQGAGGCIKTVQGIIQTL